MTVRLQVSELRVGYGSVVILQGVGVVLNEGEIVCIAGPNGAGKSTLLKAVAGILPWRTGSVVIDGIAAESGQTRDLARQHLSYVPQVANIFPSLTVEENIAVVLRDRGRRRRQELDRAFTSFPGLRDLRTQMGGSLSGGQRQALAFAMALVRQPRLLLLDEPSAALAPAAAAEVFQRIGALRDSGVPILLVEQNVNLALRVSDRAYILDGGRNAIEGPAAEIRDDPNVRRVYLGGHVDTPNSC